MIFRKTNFKIMIWLIETHSGMGVKDRVVRHFWFDYMSMHVSYQLRVDRFINLSLRTPNSDKFSLNCIFENTVNVPTGHGETIFLIILKSEMEWRRFWLLFVVSVRMRSKSMWYGIIRCLATSCSLFPFKHFAFHCGRFYNN